MPVSPLPACGPDANWAASRDVPLATWAYRIASMPVNLLGDMSEGLSMDTITEPAKLKAAATYNAAADHFDDGPLAFWDRYGRKTIARRIGISIRRNHDHRHVRPRSPY